MSGSYNLILILYWRLIQPCCIMLHIYVQESYCGLYKLTVKLLSGNVALMWFIVDRQCRKKGGVLLLFFYIYFFACRQCYFGEKYPVLFCHVPAYNFRSHLMVGNMHKRGGGVIVIFFCIPANLFLDDNFVFLFKIFDFLKILVTGSFCQCRTTR